MAAKATKATVARRVEEVLRIRLDGAQFWDVLQYVAEKEAAAEEPWAVPEGGKPIAPRTVWWYIGKADALLAETFRKEAGRKKLMRRHLAQRRGLYAKAVLQGDIKAALSVLRDEAALLGLYPPADADLAAQVAELKRMLAEAEARQREQSQGRAHANGHAAG
jgi:hypothetical protein